MDIELFFEIHPYLYHMAWEHSWPSIKQHGLLSTEALLDLFEYNGEERHRILTQRRAENIVIHHPKLGKAVIRDQKPISDVKLSRCLSEGMTTSEWYAFLNGRVFFWTTQERLFRLMGAAAYRNQRHCVLELDTRSLFFDCASQITFSPINSGATFVAGPVRGPHTFSPIDSFPYGIYRQKGRKANDIFVELTVNYGVCNVVKHVKTVHIMQNNSIIERIHPN